MGVYVHLDQLLVGACRAGSTLSRFSKYHKLLYITLGNGEDMELVKSSDEEILPVVWIFIDLRGLETELACSEVEAVISEDGPVAFQAAKHPTVRNLVSRQL